MMADSTKCWISVLSVCLSLTAACASDADSKHASDQHAESMSSQLRQGDPERGRRLLLNNGTEDAPYFNCGVPRKVLDLARDLGMDVFADALKLERERGNSELEYDYSFARRRSGIELVTVNCLLCHAAKLGDSLIIGLGNPNADFATTGTTFGIPTDMFSLLSGALSAEENAELERLLRVSRAEADVPHPDTIGLNPANVTFAVLAAHRDPKTLSWHEQVDPAANLSVRPVFSDVPAWWNLHRRDRMFYSGYGRGDHARIMMTAALTCLDDVEEAEAIDAYFPDIEAYILSLRAPSYAEVSGRSIESERADRGREVFVTTCVRCHGDAARGIAPRTSVGIDEVGTDPAYAVGSSKQGAGAISYYFDFFNSSWYGNHGSAGRLEPSELPSMCPPPLDGVWATAPYFHNGSVPTLEAVLDPSLRPKIFRRSFKPEAYDFERLGWPFEEVAAKGDDIRVYDTTRPTMGNGGHTFAAQLSPDQRRDLLEYLKSL